MFSLRSDGRCRRTLPSSHEEAFFDVLARRRMVRSYRSDQVSTQLISRIVDAAHRSPSAGNTRSLEVLVLCNDDAQRYWDTTLPAERRSSFPWPGLLDAPVLLVPYVDSSLYVQRYGEADKAKTGLGRSADAWSVPYWWVDGGAAVENMLLAAVALELGACFFGQFEHEAAVRSTFAVPERFRAVGTVAIGHPRSEDDRPSMSSTRPRRPLAQTTHWGRW